MSKISSLGLIVLGIVLTAVFFFFVTPYLMWIGFPFFFAGLAGFFNAL